jgi:LuxR family maltose regulon positive regulatory protein
MDALIDLAETSQSSVHPPKDAAISRPFLRQHANQTLSEPLTVRELEVLTLIVQGLSNQEICDRLFLALSTVKGYNQTIYGKLQVNRRTEAVAKAQERGLV